MVLRLLTHKVFIEVSLSGPTGFAIFGCSTADRPLSFAPNTLCLFSARKSAITNRNQQQWQQQQKAPQVGSPLALPFSYFIRFVHFPRTPPF